MRVAKKGLLKVLNESIEVIADDNDGKLGVVIPYYPAQNPPGSPVSLTEDDIAEEFALQHLDDLRFDHDVGRWFKWDGNRWETNKTEIAFDYARRLCRKHRGQEYRMASKKAADGVEQMARRDQRLAVTSKNWDQDPLLLGTPAGTIDLRTSKLKKSIQEDYITKLTSVSPAPIGTPFPVFQKFLGEATGGHQDVQNFLQQFAGYCLTGLTSEHALLFIYGPGGNGKSVFLNICCETLGDYAKTAAMETFAASKSQRHSTEIAMLHGARLVSVSETESGQAWSESRINQLTGGDAISANYMRQDHFTFRPQLKLMVVGNYKPKLATVNDAARRRFNIVEFLHKPEQPDPDLATKLRAEYPAIFSWMIEGCLNWQANGLKRPEIVKQATSDYFEEQDLLGRWIEEKCERGPTKSEAATALYSCWKAFAEDNGEHPGTATSFGARMPEYGFVKKKSGTIRYQGIQLLKVTSINVPGA